MSQTLSPPPSQVTPIVDAADRQTPYMVYLFRTWFAALQPLAGTTFTGTITTAKLTGGGANGSMTFSKGVLVSQVAAT